LTILLTEKRVYMPDVYTVKALSVTIKQEVSPPVNAERTDVAITVDLFVKCSVRVSTGKPAA
jgi:hypothetical protein